jgi:hypothetical protein
MDSACSRQVTVSVNKRDAADHVIVLQVTVRRPVTVLHEGKPRCWYDPHISLSTAILLLSMGYKNTERIENGFSTRN